MVAVSWAAAGARWSSSCPPTRPDRCTSVTAGVRRSGRPSQTCSMRPGTRCTASTTSTTTAGRWRSSRRASGCAISSAAASASTSRATAIAVTTCCRSQTSCSRSTDSRSAPAADVFRSLPPTRPPATRTSTSTRSSAAARKCWCRRLVGRLRAGLKDILTDIRDDLEEFGVHPDRWFSERSLSEDGAIDRALDLLRKNGVVYEKDGAQWFRATDSATRRTGWSCGRTVREPICLRHRLPPQQARAGFEQLVDILGADHHGYLARVRAGLVAMGQPGDSLEVRLLQFVTLYRGGEKAQMSTRSGEFVTLRELRSEVGNDAAFLLRDAQQRPAPRLRSRAGEVAVRQPGLLHPVRARAGVQRDAPARGEGHAYDAAQGRASLSQLTEPHELALLTSLSRYPEVIEPPRCNARRTRWCITCAISRTISTPTTTRTPSSSRCAAARCAADARSRAATGRRERPRAAGRLRPGENVMTPSRTWRATTSTSAATRRAQGFTGWMGLLIGLSIGLAVALGVFLHYRNPAPEQPTPEATAAPASAQVSETAPPGTGPCGRATRVRLLQDAARAGSRGAEGRARAVNPVAPAGVRGDVTCRWDRSRAWTRRRRCRPARAARHRVPHPAVHLAGRDLVPRTHRADRHRRGARRGARQAGRGGSRSDGRVVPGRRDPAALIYERTAANEDVLSTNAAVLDWSLPGAVRASVR